MAEVVPEHCHISGDPFQDMEGENGQKLMGNHFLFFTCFQITLISNSHGILVCFALSVVKWQYFQTPVLSVVFSELFMILVITLMTTKENTFCKNNKFRFWRIKRVCNT